ncbi:MAG: AtpZ/AtpI family protein [Planctomycetaceae bacterium]|jgi:F0F1-type ATP synthase assembly protein I|nr:AtpZ/AtpI family protein [Planctomycetaceae bacterium]
MYNINTEENNSENDRSRKDIALAVRISNIGFEMVLPAVIGVGLDYLFGTVVLFAILGAILGAVLGFWQLIRIASKNDR